MSDNVVEQLNNLSVKENKKVRKHKQIQFQSNFPISSNKYSLKMLIHTVNICNFQWNKVMDKNLSESI